MSVEKLAYQYGWDLAAAEQGYASFNEFQKAAGEWLLALDCLLPR